MKALLTVLFLSPLLAYSQATFEFLQHFDLEEIEDLVNDFGAPEGTVKINYEVDYYKITYQTLHPNGDSVLVTGAMVVPSESLCPVPLSSYMHGTVFEKTDVPSYQNSEGELGIIHASSGYVVTMPDYIGLGDSPGLHLYVHAESEARASLDLLRVARDLTDDIGYELNDQLFTFGYSQGGHSCMALHKMIEEEVPEEFTVTHSTPMSGPYDMSGAQAQPILNNDPYSVPGYIPYLVLGYQEVYGNLYDSLDEIFKPNVVTVIEDYLAGEITLTQANFMLPSLPSFMFTDEYYAAVQTDPEHPLRLALADNNVYDWAPVSPVTMYACTADEQVFYENAEVTLEAMEANGAANVTLSNLGNLNHGGCAPFALFFGYGVFEAAKESNNEATLTLLTTNATTDNGMNGSAEAFVFSAPDPFTIEWSTGETGTSIDALAAGVYSASVVDEFGCRITQLFEIEEVMSVFENEKTAWRLLQNGTQLIIEDAEVGQQFDLYSANGQWLHSLQAIDLHLEFDLSALPVGYYLVRSGGVGIGFVR